LKQEFSGQAKMENEGSDNMTKDNTVRMKEKGKLSKSRYMGYLQCPRLFYYSVNLKDQIPPFDEATLFRFKQGEMVGKAATDEFPGGVRVEPFPLDAAVKNTQEALKNGAEYVYEASFEHQGVHCKVDILHNLGKSVFDIYEVKSTKETSPEHIPDVAIQRWIIEGAGYHVRDTYVMHLNADYVHPVGELFKKELCTEEAKLLLNDIPNHVEEMKRVAELDKPPEMDIGKHCSDPHDCPLWDMCWAKIPELSIFNIPDYRKKWPLYDSGIVKLEDLPDVPLNDKQKRFIQACRTGKPVVDKHAIKKELEGLIEPLYFLDFETIMWAIPKHNGMSPNTVLTFQWSVHKLENDVLTHDAYLHSEADDPRVPLIEKLLDALGETGSIAVYSHYERDCLNGLARAFPEYRNRIDRVIARLWDMLLVFRNYYTDARFLGSNSIKKVLPVMVPGLSYADLEIQEGGTASVMFARMIEADGEEKEKVRAAMLEYCKRDTEAMVEIYRVLDIVVR
jgi:hypothetical protein